MNRRKKGNQILKARAKKASAKLASGKKPKYVSKAEREKLAMEKEQVECEVMVQIKPVE
ncbi:DUF2986 domain-containing protein [Paraglaciecola aquimarina]|uniref:DUF2986 domain-containing protein n=1 Tax=Paraglaciecola aquimarina TaxID=1235557 RepID=A0ABU3STT0_9ALTE|nr:DUF2986 domain-containing protein [Paraglaciecola aquimarina]MDU0353413.1 DUF2986 domain-containing protein [Paraglaciecola aquimarina]